MPLIIDLKPGEKLIINGAVLENASSNTKVRVLNDCSILRQKEILSDADSVTPASRVYFALQCAYIFPAKRGEYLRMFSHYLDSYVQACPSASVLATEISDAVAEGHYYKALKSTRHLLDHEKKVLGLLHDAAEAEVVAEEAETVEE